MVGGDFFDVGQGGLRLRRGSSSDMDQSPLMRVGVAEMGSEGSRGFELRRSRSTSISTSRSVWSLDSSALVRSGEMWFPDRSAAPRNRRGPWRRGSGRRGRRTSPSRRARPSGRPTDTCAPPSDRRGSPSIVRNRVRAVAAKRSTRASSARSLARRIASFIAGEVALRPRPRRGPRGRSGSCRPPPCPCRSAGRGRRRRGAGPPPIRPKRTG